MGKKALIFIIVGVVLGLGLGILGVYLVLDKINAENNPEPEIVEEFDLKDGSRLTLTKVQVPLFQTTSKKSFLQADFTIVFKNAEALALAETMQDDIKDAIMSVFEIKTAEELNTPSARNEMKEPVLNAVRELYNSEEDRENIVAVMIPSFFIVT